MENEMNRVKVKESRSQRSRVPTWTPSSNATDQHRSLISNSISQPTVKDSTLDLDLVDNKSLGRSLGRYDMFVPARPGPLLFGNNLHPDQIFTLRDDFSFDFVDGFLPSEPAAGVDLFYSPPYYSFWNDYAVESVRKAHSWLRDLIKRNGPYDGVMCFSQGCSLIASFCLYHQAETPDQPLPFKVAIFICGGLPLHGLEDVGIEVSQEAWDMNDRSAKALAEQASADSILKSGLSRWVNAEGVNSNGDVAIDPTNVFGLDFTKIPKHLRIQVPTVHIYGNKDPRCPASLQLAQFSDPTLRKTYDHGGGHDVPRKTAVSESIAQLVEWSALAAGVH
ncbi:MAG: hypothetical protein LQ338_004723 [Usnochroma carphineum]|nr:MAG: hypothetical protein LQ338_004723 [Usnochroma carphineum]